MVGAVGFLLLVSLMVNALMNILNKHLMAIFPEVAVYLFYALNNVIILAIVTLLFTLIFKTLPDGKVPWKYSLIGSGFTAVLFVIGKVASAYGAAGSLIVILIWIYYSAIILYFGAEFTRVYTYAHGQKIIPHEFSVEIKKEQVEIA